MRFPLPSLVLLSTAVLSVTLLATAAHADDWSKRWTVSGAADLRVETNDARIDVEPAAGSEIEAHVVTEGYKIGTSDVRITERQTAGRVELEVHIPQNHWMEVNMHPRSVHIELRIPANTSSDLHTGDGSIHINGVKGAMHATSGDGSIEVMDAEGSLVAHSGDGHIKVRARLDALDLETSDGSIEAELLRGSHMNSGWRLQSGDGHITMRVPDDFQADVEAHTGDGAVTLDVPNSTMEGSARNRGEFRGKINGGGQVITIHTGDGSIRVERT